MKVHSYYNADIMIEAILACTVFYTDDQKIHIWQGKVFGESLAICNIYQSFSPSKLLLCTYVVCSHYTIVHAHT